MISFNVETIQMFINLLSEIIGGGIIGVLFAIYETYKNRKSKKEQKNNNVKKILIWLFINRETSKELVKIIDKNKIPFTKYDINQFFTLLSNLDDLPLDSFTKIVLIKNEMVKVNELITRLGRSNRNEKQRSDLIKKYSINIEKLINDLVNENFIKSKYISEIEYQNLITILF